MTGAEMECLFFSGMKTRRNKKAKSDFRNFTLWGNAKKCNFLSGTKFLAFNLEITEKLQKQNEENRKRIYSMILFRGFARTDSNLN